ncbi:MAG: PAS domain S-box protein [Proteobacteria bacterium]|nr:PAS domain S-box protein [Pseudomonadota bacterium]
MYFRNTRATVNKFYMLLNLSFAIHAFIEFGYRQSASYEEVAFWWRLDFFWPIMQPLALYTVLAFVGNINALKNKWVHTFAWGPALFFVLSDSTMNIVTGKPIKHYWGWSYGVPNKSLVFYNLAYLWIFTVCMIAIYIAFFYYRRALTPQKRKQRFFFLLGVGFPVWPGLIEMVLRWLAIEAPPVTVASYVVTNLFLAYAIWKYELFALTPITAAESIVSTMSDALLLVNNNRTIESCNNATTELLGYRQKDLSGAPVEEIFAENTDRPDWVSNTDIDSLKERVKYLETRLRTNNAREIPVSLASSLLNDDRGNRLGFLLIARDNTERIKKEQELNLHKYHLEKLVTQRTQDLDATNQDLAKSREQLRFLSERLVLAKEEESARIARELHDELGQILTGLKIDISLFDKHLKKEMWFNQKEYEARIKGIIGLVDSAIKGVQGITKGLPPAMLDDIGLVATCEWMIGEFNRRTGMECSFDHRVNDEDYDRAFSAAVYRIVQESLTNVARHSKAEDVTIYMKETADTLQVSIEDNGIGIKDEEVSGFHSVGILGMTERAYTFGGQVNVKGLKGRGTSVQLSVPVLRSRNAKNTDCR